MDILKFAEQLSASAQQDGPSRWAHSTRSTVIEAVLHLAHYAEEIPTDLRGDYENFLREALESLPEGTRLNMSLALQRRLFDVAPKDVEPRLRDLVGNESATG